MKQVYELDRHEKLNDIEYNQNFIDSVCSQILEETIEQYDSNKLWPVHELDFDEEKEFGLTDIYYGSAGIVWLLRTLKVEGLDYIDIIENSLEVYKKTVKKEHSALFFGEVGIRLVKELDNPSNENRDQLANLIEQHVDNKFNEVLFGNQGTLLASYYLSINSQDVRFKDLFNKTKDQVFASWIYDEKQSCYLWTQHFEDDLQFIGAAHGTFGNIQALMACKELLSTDEVNLIVERAEQLFKNLLVITDDGEVNWKTRTNSDKTPLMHWCHGAPGIVCSLSHILPRSKEIDDIFIKAGETILKAGPLKKGTSLCHGTSGNGFAFLKLYKRFNDDIWLKRAKNFLMHSAQQSLDLKDEYGDFRYSLWTGDHGVVYLNSQIQSQTADLPMFDCI